MAKNDLQGSLDLLILKTLAQMGDLHGYGIVLHIQRATDALLSVEEGSLYPALHRMEQSGWVTSKWALTETKRKPCSTGSPPQVASSSRKPKKASSRSSKASAACCATHKELEYL